MSSIHSDSPLQNVQTTSVSTSPVSNEEKKVDPNVQSAAKVLHVMSDADLKGLEELEAILLNLVDEPDVKAELPIEPKTEAQPLPNMQAPERPSPMAPRPGMSPGSQAAQKGLEYARALRPGANLSPEAKLAELNREVPPDTLPPAPAPPAQAPTQAKTVNLPAGTSIPQKPQYAAPSRPSLKREDSSLEGFYQPMPNFESTRKANEKGEASSLKTTSEDTIGQDDLSKVKAEVKTETNPREIVKSSAKKVRSLVMTAFNGISKAFSRAKPQAENTNVNTIQSQLLAQTAKTNVYEMDKPSKIKVEGKDIQLTPSKINGENSTILLKLEGKKFDDEKPTANPTIASLIAGGGKEKPISDNKGSINMAQIKALVQDFIVQETKKNPYAPVMVVVDTGDELLTFGTDSDVNLRSDIESDLLIGNKRTLIRPSAQDDPFRS